MEIPTSYIQTASAFHTMELNSTGARSARLLSDAVDSRSIMNGSEEQMKLPMCWWHLRLLSLVAHDEIDRLPPSKEHRIDGIVQIEDQCNEPPFIPTLWRCF